MSNDEIKDSTISKLRYLKGVSSLKKIINEWKPDIVHAHYASSYGLIGALLNFHPFVLSVWGTDVFEFPKKNFLSKLILKFVFQKADKLLSTSKCMADEVSKYTTKKINIIPFGVDVELFKKSGRRSLFDKNDIVIGTVKKLEKVYCIDKLIKAFSILISQHPELSLKLLIVGSGTMEKELKSLAKKMSLEKDIYFTGYIPNELTINYYSEMDAAVFLSTNESFGVSILEANACEVPVVATNVGGFKEIIIDQITGILVEPDDPAAAAIAIERIITNKELCLSLTNAARERICEKYEQSKSIARLISIYQELAA